MTMWFIIALVACTIAFAILCHCAPEAYQDETGYHLGREPEDEEWR